MRRLLITGSRFWDDWITVRYALAARQLERIGRAQATKRKGQ